MFSAISRFYNNYKKQIAGKKGFPKFKKHCRSLEYKTSGCQLSENRKAITFSDKKGIGKLKLKGTYDLNYDRLYQIKRIRLVRLSDGYYCQFAIKVDVQIETEPTGKAIRFRCGHKILFSIKYSGSSTKEVQLKSGIKKFLTFRDVPHQTKKRYINGNVVENPQFYRQAEKQLKLAHRQKSKKYKKSAKPQSKNYHKARKR